MDSLMKNHTWNLVKRPKKQKVIGCRWILTKKPGIPGVEKPRYKTRLVAKGYAQKVGVDFQEIVSPVVKHVSIRILLSMTVNYDLELEQLDVKTAFLHGEVEEDIFMEQPEGFVVKDREDDVCHLKKSLYGLKQAPCQWNKCFDQYMVEIGFKRSQFDLCVYFKDLGKDGYLYLLLYVDDMLVASKSMDEIKKVKSLLSDRFEMKDLGHANRILGMDIERDRAAGVLTLSQTSYIKKILQVFRVDEAKAVSTPIGAHFKLAAIQEEDESACEVPYCNAVGSIMYAMICTRPDVAYAIGLVSRFMSNPGNVHWTAIRWLLKYLKGMQDKKLVFTKGSDFRVEGFSDSDYAGDKDRRRSITGYVFRVGGNVVSWKSNLQQVVALSTTEAEYIALSEAVKEGIWLRGLVEELGFKQEATDIWCDSQSAICLAKNNVFHERTKHVAVKYHFIRDETEVGTVKIQKIPTERNPADMLTKVIPVQKFEKALALLKVTR
ncbi:unnamed protein product [Microthlaspi erraticum]|uniref:Reverse transcriptase Ty1/copia-type domain-containing protein n=1 Tax=Microthlaspi erraticum TaxID=1685480 RepID=A0A6D2J922_9BRAS|nr:unnamed protein product [Microthlaspi erraticum]